MRIFRIKADSNNVQAVQPVNPNVSKMDFLKFDCEPKKASWKQLEFYIYNPKTQSKNFYNIGWEALVFNEKVLTICQAVFEKSGEILPIQVEREDNLYILNVLNCIDCLDYEKSKWNIYPNGRKGRILNYVFLEDKLKNYLDIFKIPETRATSIYCYIEDEMKENCFYNLYHKNNLTGLEFEEM